jgi:hypothetical protein
MKAVTLKKEATMRDLCVLFIEVPYRHVYSDVEQISLYHSILHVCCRFFNKLYYCMRIF